MCATGEQLAVAHDASVRQVMLSHSGIDTVGYMHSARARRADSLPLRAVSAEVSVAQPVRVRQSSDAIVVPLFAGPLIHNCDLIPKHCIWSSRRP